MCPRPGKVPSIGGNVMNDDWWFELSLIKLFLFKYIDKHLRMSLFDYRSVVRWATVLHYNYFFIFYICGVYCSLHEFSRNAIPLGVSRGIPFGVLLGIYRFLLDFLLETLRTFLELSVGCSWSSSANFSRIFFMGNSSKSSSRSYYGNSCRSCSGNRFRSSSRSFWNCLWRVLLGILQEILSGISPDVPPGITAITREFWWYHI